MPHGSEAAAGAPRWDLGTIYASFDAPERARDKAALTAAAARLGDLLATPFPTEPAALRARLSAALVAMNEAGDLSENLEAFASAAYTTDTRDSRALAEINALETLSLPLGKALVLFRQRVAAAGSAVTAAAAGDPELAAYAFYLGEAAERAAKQLPEDLEDLANDLSRSGGDAWSRLQEALSSTASALWDPATGETKTAIALRALAHDGDRTVRAKAFAAELAAWKAVEIPMAAALNGVKGFAGTLDDRRGWPDALSKACFQARMSRPALDALIAALEDALPLFRRYLKVKAAALGIERCAFYDLFAPVGSAGRKWSFPAAAAYVAERFAAFDPELGAFAERAFRENWIDAEPRDGKVGGAYCADFPLPGESRILCNFDGSFASVVTLAHELGHAWHHEVIKDQPRLLSGYPMTLAETASIFAETVVFEDALAKAGPDERIGLIEGSLKDSCQVIVDILSRFKFESEVFARRREAELAPAEFCRLMAEAQTATYGDGLDPDALHPYMWAVKGHYYRPGLAFYNFPYAFGLLFALGLYARFEAEGKGFPAVYRTLLSMTGRASANEVARAAGFDLEDAAFWRGAVAVIAKRVDEFERLVKELP
jgi:pepF/M3 family oligoendopeptidase